MKNLKKKHMHQILNFVIIFLAIYKLSRKLNKVVKSHEKFQTESILEELQRPIKCVNLTIRYLETFISFCTFHEHHGFRFCFFRNNDSQNFRNIHRRYIDRCTKSGTHAESSGRGDMRIEMHKIQSYLMEQELSITNVMKLSENCRSMLRIGLTNTKLMRN